MNDPRLAPGAGEMAPEPKRCILCERVSGIFGLLLGSVILFIAIDVLSGGRLSDMIGGRTEEVPDDES
jgi:hypothetical protein